MEKDKTVITTIPETPESTENSLIHLKSGKIIPVSMNTPEVKENDWNLYKSTQDKIGYYIHSREIEYIEHKSAE